MKKIIIPTAVQSLAFTLLIGAMASCSNTPETDASEEQSPADLTPLQEETQGCGQLTAQTSEFNGLPLGLSVVDANSQTPTGAVQLDCNKDVAIFVHGWSLSGTPTAFEHADLWQKNGFQTLVFRWHDLSSNVSFGAAFLDNTRQAADRLTSALRHLYTQLGGSKYKKEIRIIGHSFGAKVAIEAVSNVTPIEGLEKSRQASAATAGTNIETHSDLSSDHYVPVARLSLLDPAVFANWSDGKLPLCPNLYLNFETAKDEDPDLGEEVSRVSSLLGMIPSSTQIELYATNMASTLSYQLSRRMQLQTLTRPSVLNCFVSFEDLNWVEVHNAVVSGYLESIDREAPRLQGDGPSMNSAATPTAELSTQPGWYVLQQGDPRSNWNEHIYVKKEISDRSLQLNIGDGCRPNADDVDCEVSAEFLFNF